MRIIYEEGIWSIRQHCHRHPCQFQCSRIPLLEPLLERGGAYRILKPVLENVLAILSGENWQRLHTISEMFGLSNHRS